MKQKISIRRRDGVKQRYTIGRTPKPIKPKMIPQKKGTDKITNFGSSPIDKEQIEKKLKTMEREYESLPSSSKSKDKMYKSYWKLKRKLDDDPQNFGASPNRTYGESTIEELEQDIKEYETEIDEYEDKLTDYEAKINKLKSEIKTNEDDLNRQRKQLEEELEKELSYGQKQIDKLKEEIDAEQENIDTYKNFIESNKSRISIAKYIIEKKKKKDEDIALYGADK